MSEIPMEDQRFYRDEDFSDDDGTVHGLRCSDCKSLFVDGQPISERFEGLLVDLPIVRLVCVPCAMGEAVHV